jgi:hypothetical protein
MSVYKYIFTYFPGRQQLLEYDKLSTLLSTIFQQYRGSRLYRWRKTVYTEKATTYSKWLNKFITSRNIVERSVDNLSYSKSCCLPGKYVNIYLYTDINVNLIGVKMEPPPPKKYNKRVDIKYSANIPMST